MKKRFMFLTALFAVSFAFAGCGDSNVSYADGSYEGTSEVYENEDVDHTHPHP